MRDVITHYRLVVKDITSGRRRPVEGRDLIEGRYPAEAIRERLQRENRNPNLQYELERSTAPRAQQPGDQSGIFEHHFGERRW